MAEPLEGQSVKARRRVGGKAAGRQSATKVKTTIHITAEASQRLAVHAAMMGMDRSELIESLIQEHLRRFVVSDRGKTDGSAPTLAMG